MGQDSLFSMKAGTGEGFWGFCASDMAMPSKWFDISATEAVRSSGSVATNEGVEIPSFIGVVSEKGVTERL